MNTFRVFYLANEHFSRALFDFTDLSKDPAKYKEVATLEEENTDDVFRQMNVVDGTELPVRLRVRSMSVGDVIINVNEAKAFVVASFGFDELASDVYKLFIARFAR